MYVFILNEVHTVLFPAMDSNQFRDYGKRMIDYCADYLDNIRSRPVRGDVRPGYIQHFIPEIAPTEPESFEDVLEDIEPIIMPGVTHWHHPNFYAFFPTGEVAVKFTICSFGCHLVRRHKLAKFDLPSSARCSIDRFFYSKSEPLVEFRL